MNYMQGDIANLRAHGGDVILNFGGYAAGVIQMIHLSIHNNK